MALSSTRSPIWSGDRAFFLSPAAAVAPTPARRVSRRPRRIATLGASVAFHALALALLIPTLADGPTFPPPPRFSTAVIEPAPILEPPEPEPPSPIDAEPYDEVPLLPPPPEPPFPPRPPAAAFAEPADPIALPARDTLTAKLLLRPVRPITPAVVPEPPPTPAPAPPPVRPKPSPVRTPATSVGSLGAPRFPAARLERGDEGDVWLRVEVLPTGAAGRIEALEPRAHPDFEAAAIRWARHLAYEAARVDDRPVTSWLRLPVVKFRIRAR